MSDEKTPSWHEVYDDRGRSVHVSQAATSAAAEGYAYVCFRGLIYRVNRDGTWAETALTETDIK